MFSRAPSSSSSPHAAEERELSAGVQWALSSCNASAWHPALGIPRGLAPGALSAQAAGLGAC